MFMRKYVIWVSENDTKVYIKVNSSGVAEAVPDKLSASVLPNRVVAQSIISVIKHCIKKQGFNVCIGMDAV